MKNLFAIFRCSVSKMTTVQFLIILVSLQPVFSMKCWQCAAVDGRRCPDDAKSVSSPAHDACIIWKMGNGTILLQNLVRFDEECVSSKVDFWSRFIDLYYQGVGGSVRCCSGDGCNSGEMSDGEMSVRKPDKTRSSAIHASPPSSASLPGAPLSPFFAASNVIPDQIIDRHQTIQQQPAPTPVRQQPQQQPVLHRPPTKLQPVQNGYPSYPPSPNYPSYPKNPTYPQIQQESFQQKRLQLAAPTADDFSIIGGSFADGSIDGFPSTNRNGNCQQYFDRVASEEWLPRILVPLTFDRASETKVGVFYTRLKTYSSSNDHVIIRILDKDKKNTTMYTFKLFQVGTVSVHLNQLEADSRGDLKQVEVRKESLNHAINLTDTRFIGFWITVRNEELALGKIGNPLTQPLITWNDTLREGPRDPFYFGLTTDQSSASFGVNCDVPNLHFSDTCVTDNDCDKIPNTVCRHAPVNRGLDPGTRKLPYEQWLPRDSLLKSCFCKAGHVRIPESKGCYDPIRRVVTLRDACFADSHCNDLPNTQCAFDKDIPRYNMSCQCVRGNRPFDPDPRTGLIEGCAPLTSEDMGTILGCSTRFSVNAAVTEWVPKDTMYAMDFDADMNADVGVFFVNLGSEGGNNDEAIIRLLDEAKSSSKMLTIKFQRNNGRISISESSRTTGFFFSNGERDFEKANYEDMETLGRMESGYVGYWVMYQYEKGIGGVLTVGMNGSPLTPDYAIVKWTDTTESALKNIKYMGFTSSNGAKVGYGVNCALVKASPQDNLPYIQVAQQQPLNGLTGFGHTFSNDPSGRYGPIVTNLNQARPLHSNNLLRQIPLGGGTPPPTGLGGSWDYDTSRVDSFENDYATEAETIIEPVLRNQYLTKLKRLLPTFFEDFDSHEIEALLGNSTIQAIEDWDGGLGASPVPSSADEEVIKEKPEEKEEPIEID